MKLTDLSNSIRSIMTLALLMLVTSIEAQTARKFTLNLTDDGKAQMVCFLPQTPSGKAIVGVPGGGYSVLSNTHEGTMASDWLNKQGIAYFARLCKDMEHQPQRRGYHGLFGWWTPGISHLHAFCF